MILVSFLYGACWLPQNLLMNIFFPTIECLDQRQYIFYIYFAVHITAMSHSIVNPPIYVWRNAKLRAGFAYCIRCLPGVNYENRFAHELSMHQYATTTTRTRPSTHRVKNGAHDSSKSFRFVH